jgi:hypothetical protein
MPLLDQIELVRGAEVILAPHGMGLTHLVFHDGRPLIVELHNAGLGTDAYAFMAHALGFRYRAVLGRDLGAPEHHFVIPEDEAMNVLAQEGIYPPGATGSDTAARQRVRFLGGVQSVMATEVFDVPPSQPGTAALRHVRDDVAVQPDNNTGWLEVAELIEGAVYHCACDVWIPAAFRGERVLLDSALGGRRVWPADMDKRDRWQTIAVAGTARESVTNFVLRCDAEAGSVFYTCAWRRGEGIETAPA